MINFVTFLIYNLNYYSTSMDSEDSHTDLSEEFVNFGKGRVKEQNGVSKCSDTF